MEKLKKYLALTLMALTIMAVALPAAPASAQTGIGIGSTAYVNITSGTLNIRSTPSNTSSSNIVGSATRGQALSILGYTTTGTTVSGSAYWYRVQFQKSPYTQGWAHHSFISTTDPGGGSSGGGTTVSNPTTNKYNCGTDEPCPYRATSTYFSKKVKGLEFHEYDSCSQHANCKVIVRKILQGGFCPSCDNNHMDLDVYATSVRHYDTRTGGTTSSSQSYHGAVVNGQFSNPNNEYTAAERQLVLDFMSYPKEEFAEYYTYDEY